MDKAEKMKVWIFHGEWIAMMSVVVGLFVFSHHDIKHVNERLDSHILQINRRVDDINKRADDLHQEFYELLREMRR
jgi:hypothetical protein